MKLTRGQLAKATDCNPETIRYYESTGLIPAPGRADNGYRIYDELHLKKLRFIQRAKALGFSTDIIRSLLRITEDSSKFTRAEVKALTDEHIADIGQKITALSALRDSLTQLADHCDGAQESAEHCPILNSLYPE